MGGDFVRRERGLDGFEEDGDAVEGFVAERALVGCELEGVGCFIGEGGGVLFVRGRRVPIRGLFILIVTKAVRGFVSDVCINKNPAK